VQLKETKQGKGTKIAPGSFLLCFGVLADFCFCCMMGAIFKYQGRLFLVRFDSNELIQTNITHLGRKPTCVFNITQTTPRAPAFACGVQALLPTSAHSNRFCITRACISASTGKIRNSRCINIFGAIFICIQEIS